MPGSDWNGGEKGKENELRVKEEELKLKERKSEIKKKEKELKEKEDKLKQKTNEIKKTTIGSQTGGCPAPTYGWAAWPFGQPRPFRSEEWIIWDFLVKINLLQNYLSWFHYSNV